MYNIVIHILARLLYYNTLKGIVRSQGFTAATIGRRRSVSTSRVPARRSLYTAYRQAHAHVHTTYTRLYSSFKRASADYGPDRVNLSRARNFKIILRR